MLIAQIHAELLPAADLATRRRALRAKAWWFHGGTSWGRRVWAARCAAYLARYGAKPRDRRSQLAQRQQIAMFAPDITFPFREGAI